MYVCIICCISITYFGPLSFQVKEIPLYVRRSQLVAAWALLFVTLWGAWRCSGDKEEMGGGELFTGALGTHTHTHTHYQVFVCVRTSNGVYGLPRNRNLIARFTAACMHGEMVFVVRV